MEEKYIKEILESDDYSELRNFYSVDELKDKLKKSLLDKKQFDTLFGPYGVIFPIIDSLKENLRERTASILQKILNNKNNQELEEWLNHQSADYKKESTNIQNLHNIVWNNRITFHKEYILDDGQIDNVPVSKSMIENLMSSNDQAIITEVQNFVREILEKCISQFQPKKDSEFWLRKYMADYMNNQNDKQLLENFIAQAKTAKFAEAVISFFDQVLVFQWDAYRNLQTELYEKAISWQEKFAAEEFCCVSQNYPTMRNVETPDFKAIGKLVLDLRLLKKTPDLINELINEQLERSSLSR